MGSIEVSMDRVAAVGASRWLRMGGLFVNRGTWLTRRVEWNPPFWEQRVSLVNCPPTSLQSTAVTPISRRGSRSSRASRFSPRRTLDLGFLKAKVGWKHLRSSCSVRVVCHD